MTATREQIASEMLAESNGTVPVFEPRSETLKAVPRARAQHFQEMGYHVGTDAQAMALRHSTAAKVGAFLTNFGNTGSAGLFNAGMSVAAKLGNQTAKNALHEQANASADNPGSALAGSLTGLGASAFAGPLRFGGIGKTALAAAAERGGMASILARTGNVALQGAPALAVQGASDALTRQTLLGSPVSLESMAASAMHDVLYGAAANLFAHGAIKGIRTVRKGAGNLLNRLEDMHVIEGNYEDLPRDPSQPKAQAKTQIFEREYPTGQQGPISQPSGQLGAERQLEAAAGPGEAPAPDLAAEPLVEPEPSAEHGIDRYDQASDVELHPTQEAAKAAETTAEALNRVEPGPEPSPGLPEAVREAPTPQPPLAPMPRLGAAKAPIEYSPELEAVPHVEGLGMKRARLAAAKAAEEAESLKALRPEDIEWEFDYGKKRYTQKQKLHVIREWIKEGAAEAHPDAPQIYDIIQNLEDHSQALIAEHKASVKAKGPGIPDIQGKVQRIWAEKAQWKDELRKLFPRKIDTESGMASPGYDDLNREYARVVNPGRNFGDVVRPEFVSREGKAFEAASEAHAQALTKAENAEAHLKLLEDHHAELEARDAVIERNRAATNDAAQKTKAAAQEAKIAERERQALAKAAEKERAAAIKAKTKAEQKAASEAAKAEKAAIREKAAAERKRLAETAKAEKQAARDADKAKRDAERERVKRARDAAREAAQKAREAEKAIRQQAQAAKTAEREAGIPRYSAANPKSIKTERYSVDSETAEGLRKDTYERKDYGHKVREKHRVTIKAPVEPPDTRFKGYKDPFTGQQIGLAMLGSGMPALGVISSLAAKGMFAANVATRIASQRQAIGAAFEAVADGLNKYAVPVGIAAAREHRPSNRSSLKGQPYNVKDYESVTKAARAIAASPGVVQSHMQTRYPAFAARDPNNFQAVSAKVQNAIEQFADQIPKKPYDPTLQAQDFMPTRAQQVRTMAAWRLLSDPHLALELADPANVRLLESVYPQLFAAYRTSVMHDIQRTQKPIYGRQARQMSALLGSNVRPMDDADALKRLQQTAGPEPAQQPQQGGNAIGSRNPSSKITNQAVQRDMPLTGLYQLG